LKPSIFKNELLATSDPLYTVIFEGLWCIGDREGRLEDRPRRIHLEINAGRAFEGTETALNWLAENGFILRYEHEGIRYIQVLTFAKHQNPHAREPASTIPAPGEHQSSTGPAPVEHQYGPALSPFPLPESPIQSGRAEAAPLALHASLPKEAWEEWLAHRREKRLSMSPRALNKQLKLLAAYAPEVQREIIDTSINAGWEGLFPPKGKPRASPTNGRHELPDAFDVARRAAGKP